MYTFFQAYKNMYVQKYIHKPKYETSSIILFSSIGINWWYNNSILHFSYLYCVRYIGTCLGYFIWSLIQGFTFISWFIFEHDLVTNFIVILYSAKISTVIIIINLHLLFLMYWLPVWIMSNGGNHITERYQLEHSITFNYIWGREKCKLKA